MPRLVISGEEALSTYTDFMQTRTGDYDSNGSVLHLVMDGDNSIACSGCYGTISNGSRITISTYCYTTNVTHEACANVTSCNECERQIPYATQRTVVVSRRDLMYICGDCLDNGDYSYCEHCDSHVVDDFWDMDNGVCITCSNNISQEDEEQLIHDYSYKPRARFMYGGGLTTNDPTAFDDLFIGAEIELEARSGYDLNDLARETKNSVARQAYLKHDGSLSNGFEVVTHPATFDWWKENDNVVVNALSALQGRARSYHSPNCGMHIHMSKNAFTSFHLMRFLHFIYNNQQFVEFIAQRRSQGYARFFPEAKNEIVKMAKDKRNSYNYGRFVAVNLENAATLELRVFKGNLEPFRILKNIEFAHALYEFTKITPSGYELTELVMANIHDHNKESVELATKDLSPRMFKTWVAENSHKYTHLHEFISAWKGR